MRETLPVLGSASNARRLLERVAQADAGLLEEHLLFEPEQWKPLRACLVPVAASERIAGR
jgi:hypothetical protein